MKLILPGCVIDPKHGFSTPLVSASWGDDDDGSLTTENMKGRICHNACQEDPSPWMNQLAQAGQCAPQLGQLLGLIGQVARLVETIAPLAAAAVI
jgi:hypothetical protein